MLDTCEAASMFDDIVAPNLFLLGTSKHGESAVSDTQDGVLNTNGQDKPTEKFSYFLNNMFHRKPDFKLGEFAKQFPASDIVSHIYWKNTHPTRKLDDVALREFIPISKDHVINGKGIDEA